MSQNGYLDKAGDFVVRVEPRFDSWFTKSKEKGTLGIRLTLVVDEGPEEGAKAEYYGWLTPAAEDRTLATFAKVFGDLWDIDNIDALIGERARISVELEEYDGKLRAKVNWLNPLNGGGNSAPEGKEVEGLLARLRSKSKAITSKVLEDEGKPVERDGKKPSVATEEDPEIPF